MSLGDLDADGDLDAFVTASSDQDNRVWINDGEGNFSDSGERLGNQYTFDASLGDLDDDGDLDAFTVSLFGQANRVWVNQDAPRVTDVLLRGGAWTPGFLDELEPIGLGGTRGYTIPVGTNTTALNSLKI